MTMEANGKSPRSTSRYRKVEVRTWGDEKFRSLSPIPPCGQGLWLFLITGPHTSPIPGLSRAGRASMAEELGWSVEAFDQAFAEAFEQGMVKADFKARLVWVPKAIRHNRPESPNVVRSWGAEFDLMPECDLKREAYEALRASVRALGEPFAKAFDETFAKPSGKPSGKALPKAMPNQEQEQEQQQEQQQEQEKDPSSLRSDSSPTDVVDPPARIVERSECSAGALSLVPPTDIASRNAELLRQITEDAITAFNATLAKPEGLLARARALPAKQANVKRCVSTARAICQHIFGSAVITPEFWSSYFTTCAEDDFLSGRNGGGEGHENWLPDFEFLTRPATMAKIFDQATSPEEAA